MRRSTRKPTKWDWYLCAGVVMAGALLLPTRWSDAAGGLILVGAGLLTGLMVQRHSYRILPEEAQRRADREEQDERNRMLRERAGWICWRAESLLWAAAALVFVNVTEHYKLAWLVLGLWTLRLLAERAVYVWLNRKY